MIQKKIFAGLVAGAMLAGASVSAATVTIVDSSTQGGGNQAHVFGAGYNAYTNGGAGWNADPTWTPPPANQGGISQSPFNNTPIAASQTYFASIFNGAPGDGGGAQSPVTLTFGKTQSAFNILWGSIDSYNEIEFLLLGASQLVQTGTDIVNLGSLGGVTPTFEQVALVKFSDLQFDSVKFTSNGQNSFEFALAPVPLPAGGLLLLGALGGLAALRRRKQAA